MNEDKNRLDKAITKEQEEISKAKDSKEEKELTIEEIEQQLEEEKEQQLQELISRRLKRKQKRRRKKITLLVFFVTAVLAAEAAGGFYLYTLMNRYKEENEKLLEELKVYRGESSETSSDAEKVSKEAKKESSDDKESSNEKEKVDTDKESSDEKEKADTDKESSDEKEKADTDKESSDDKEKDTKKSSKDKDEKKVVAASDAVEDEETATIKKYLKKAKKYAQQYNYNAAIKALKKYEDYENCEELQEAVQEYQDMKKACVSWAPEEVTHVFFHTLIKDASKAFDGDYKDDGYNQVMTTIDEFNKIIDSMYERGYVMVSIYDLATVNEDGTMSPGEILLPEGKIPFVLSQDDVCYYHYMDGDGYASKLVVDEEGKIRCEYVEDDGSISVGDYDMVPLIDRFVEEHPDFSYKGAKGIIALTGYNGILGYRTDISYETQPDDLDDVKKKWLEENPDFSLEEEREAATKVADALKEDGWIFASHTWGHLNVQEASLQRLQADTEKFKENVDPLIGGTDIIIFAFGTDLTDSGDYSGEKFEYYKEQGYNYFCNVDSSKYFVQVRDNYFRMGRRNLDGYRMYYNPEMLEDLFDASEVFDSSRPVPVPEM